MKLKSLIRSTIHGFRDFGHLIAGIINFVIVFVLYFIGIGLTSIIAKIFRKHFLQLKTYKNKPTYWIEHKLTKQNREDYYRTF